MKACKAVLSVVGVLCCGVAVGADNVLIDNIDATYVSGMTLIFR